MKMNLCFSMPSGLEWLIVLVGIFFLYFWIKTIIEIATHDFSSTGSKVAWLLVVILLGVFGAFIYVIAGRQSRI